MVAPEQGKKVEPLDAAPAAVDIDRGTTYSCGGVGKNDGVETDQGNRTTATYVASANTERVIGDAAGRPSPMSTGSPMSTASTSCWNASMCSTSGPTMPQDSCSKLAGKSGPAIPGGRARSAR